MATSGSQGGRSTYVPRLLANFTPEVYHSSVGLDTLEFVTDEEMIAQYAASEEKRKQGREDKGKEIVPDVPPDQLQVTLCAQLAPKYFPSHGHTGLPDVRNYARGFTVGRTRSIA